MSSRDYDAEHEEEERGQTRAAAVRLSPVVQMRRSRYAVSPISPAAASKREMRSPDMDGEYGVCVAMRR